MSVQCYLCKAEIDNPDDYLCSGCGEHICGNHFGDPWGDHAPEDHDEE